jgi:hypothetical protein
MHCVRCKSYCFKFKTAYFTLSLIALRIFYDVWNSNDLEFFAASAARQKLGTDRNRTRVGTSQTRQKATRLDGQATVAGTLLLRF